MKILLLAFLASAPLVAAERFEDLKKEIAACEKILEIEQPDSDKSRILYQLALAYFRDQELDRAFKCFLSSIKHIPPVAEAAVNPAEIEFYDAALQLYLAECGPDPIKTSKELLSSYEQIAHDHPEYIHLNFLLSTAYGNLGMYDLFFERFYKAYPGLAESFLAHKTQGILYLRLAQHEKEEKIRHSYREEAHLQLAHAIEKNPQDASLYKILIALAKEDNNEALETVYLQKLVAAAPKIPRGDIYLYVREAVALQEVEMAKKIVEVAKKHYEYSRAISEAEEFLKQYQG